MPNIQERLHKAGFIALLTCVAACTPLTDQSRDAPLTPMKPIPPEKAQEALGEIGGNFLYGPGLGTAALNLGTIVLFPPYALYVVGNAAANLAGYEGLYVSDALPEEERNDFNLGYDAVVSAPGRVTAAVAGKEFRSKDVAKTRLETVLEQTGTHDTTHNPGPVTTMQQ